MIAGAFSFAFLAIAASFLASFLPPAAAAGAATPFVLPTGNFTYFKTQKHEKTKNTEGGKPIPHGGVSSQEHTFGKRQSTVARTRTPAGQVTCASQWMRPI